MRDSFIYTNDRIRATTTTLESSETETDSPVQFRLCREKGSVGETKEIERDGRLIFVNNGFGKEIKEIVRERGS